jgi:hypothetical protein
MTSETPTPLRAAFEARDLDAAMAALSPEIEFRSPILGLPFVGKEEVGDLFSVVFEVLGPLTYEAEIQGDPHVLVFRTDVKGEELHGVDLLHLDEQGLVRQMMVFLRPFPGIAAFLQATAPKIGRRRRGRGTAVALAAGSAPVAALMRVTAASSPGLLDLQSRR